jgi:hypothetical protein
VDYTLPGLVADASNEAYREQAQEQVPDIHETEYSLLGHLADTVLRSARARCGRLLSRYVVAGKLTATAIKLSTLFNNIRRP